MKIPFILLCVLLVPNCSAQDSSQVPSGGATPEISRAGRIRVGSNVAAARILEKVGPEYPERAREAHVQGTVRLHIIVGVDGDVKQTELVSGHPLLAQAAIDAVRKWRYQPALLNGEPVEVDSTVDVLFSLDEKPAKVPAKVPIDRQLKADISHLLAVIHFKEQAAQGGRVMFDSMRPLIYSSLPATANRSKIVDSYAEKLTALLQSSDYLDRVVEAYAKYLSDDDIKGLTQFYETPAGQHYGAAMPQLAGDLSKIGQQIAADNMQNILRELCNEFPELQGPTGGCPGPNPEKKS